jgi:hypothetical protein
MTPFEMAEKGALIEITTQPVAAASYEKLSREMLRLSRPAVKCSYAAGLVDRGERDWVHDSGQAQIRIADQVLDDPARTVAPPMLHPALLAGDQQDLLRSCTAP